jgi:hypothetical protein
LRAQPAVGRFFDDTPDANYFVKGSCATLLLILGMGIELLGSDARVHIPRGLTPPDASLGGLFGTR